MSILVIAKMVIFGLTMDVELHLPSLLSVKTSEKLVDSLPLHVISVRIICWWKEGVGKLVNQNGENITV